MSRPSPPSTLAARSSTSIPNSDYPPLKITLLGAQSSGKTALRRRFIKGDFVGNYRATIGCDFLVKNLVLPRRTRTRSGGEDVDVADEEEELINVELSLWDTAGQERFKSISQPFYRGSLACILAFDYTMKPIEMTLKQLKIWYQEFRDKCDTIIQVQQGKGKGRGTKFVWVLVGCKMDLIVDKERKEIDRKIKKQVKKWFQEQEEEEEVGNGSASNNSLVIKTKDFNNNKRLEIGPRKQQQPLTSTLTNSPCSSSTIRPPISKKPSTLSITSSSTLSSVELSCSIPNPQVLNPKSLLLMSTSPPQPPSSVEPLGHPKAVYEGGPFTLRGRLLDQDSHHGDTVDKVEKIDAVTKVENVEDREEEEEEEEGEEGEDSENFRLFSTSAKTGQGVQEVFDYCASRILYNLSLIESNNGELGSPTTTTGVIKINELETGLSSGQKLKRACCT